MQTPLEELKARDLMRTQLFTVHEDDSVAEVITTLVGGNGVERRARRR